MILMLRPALMILLALLFAHTANAGEGLVRLPWVKVPDFSLQDMAGDTHNLARYTGKPVIVNFWASWCPSCRKEMPSMNRAWEKIKHEGIDMIAINVGEDRETVESFTQAIPVDFPVLLDKDSKTAEAWPVRGLPMTFVLDPDGKLVFRAIGSREWDDDLLLDKVRALRQ
jgi:peroxiredoxin